MGLYNSTLRYTRIHVGMTAVVWWIPDMDTQDS